MEMPAGGGMSLNLPREMDRRALASGHLQVSPESAAPGLAGVTAYV